MSFSSDVKEELSTRIDMARHCQIAEFAAIMGMSGRIRRASGKRMQIEMSTENEIARYKFIVLLEQIFDIDTGDIIYVSKSSRDTTIRIENQEYVAKILQTLKWADETFDNIEPVFVDPRIVQKDCCKKAFIRGAFIAAGSISDPNKFYHYEIVCDYEEDALTLAILLTPPISTSATQTARISEAITTDHEYSPRNGILTQCSLFASKKPFTALEIPFT